LYILVLLAHSGLSDGCVPLHMQAKVFTFAAAPASQVAPDGAATPAAAQHHEADPAAGSNSADEPDAALSADDAPAADAAAADVPEAAAGGGQPRPLPEMPPCALDLPRGHVLDTEEVQQMEINLAIYSGRERQIKATGAVRNS
jgi:hypothetical protein